MKIVLNTKSVDLINTFTQDIKSFSDSVGDIQILASRTEHGLFDAISDRDVKAFLIEVPSQYSQKSVDFIKKRHPFTPIIVFGNMESIQEISDADIYMPYYWAPNPEQDTFFLNSAMNNIFNYLNTFQTLRKLTTNISDIIEFGLCKYDPTRRTLFFKGSEIKKLSAKEGGILEVLSANFGQIVKKDIILEKVWRKSDYFSSRSMDVYLTNLRKLLKTNKIDLSINNISGVGLILE